MMMEKATLQIVHDLVERFRTHHEAYLSPGYNETQVRREFIDPLFKALGWDVDNEQGNAEQWKEVIHEDAIKIGGFTKAPDYSFRLGGRRLFFLEAKKPAVNLRDDPGPAFQLRRYAWTAKLPISILTDFEEFIVYDTRIQPAITDKSSKARILAIRFEEYVDRWEEIASIFSPEAIRKGAFDKYVESATHKRGTATVDDAFLADIESWREQLARNIALRNSGVTQRELNFAVQCIIDRIVFLRICEDRGIEDYGRLQALLNGTNIYARLRELFYSADERYNSGLFHFHKEKDREGAPDELTPRLQIDDKVLKDIFKRLYYPDCPYEFSVLPTEILGQVYERFLGSVIRLTAGGHAKVEQKPEVRKAGGVYYTPTYIVDYIVKHTVGKLLEGKTPQEIAGVTDAWRPSANRHPIAILDPACGSGSFLLGAYQLLLDWHLEQYSRNFDMWSKGKEPKLFQDHRGVWRLTTVERKRILLSNIFGVDIDAQAVEVTKLSLLLKVLEGENAETMRKQLAIFHERALPDLGANIKCGNSLIGPDFYDGRQAGLFDEEEMYRVNAFDWSAEFTEIMKRGGFDAVIGNPPYVRIQTMMEWAPVEVEHYKHAYKSAISGNYDIYVVFAEKGLSLLNETGQMGFILPNKFISTDYGAGLRKIITDGKALVEVVDFGHAQVFANATTYTCLLFLTGGTSNAVLCSKVISPSTLLMNNISPRTMSSDTFTAQPWVFGTDAEKKLTEKITRNAERLIDTQAQIGRGSSSGADDVFVLRRDGNNLITRQGEQVDIEKGILRIPIYATDFGRYQFTPRSEEVIIFPYRVTHETYELRSEAELREKFPKTFQYLSKRRKELEARKQFREWFGFSAPRNLNIHDSAQMLVPLLARRGSYCRLPQDSTEYCLMASGGFSITIESASELSPDYFLGLLNSKLLFWQLHSISNIFRGGWITCTKQYVETLPMHKVSFFEAAEKASYTGIVRLVQQILDLHKRIASARTQHDTTLLERQVTSADREIDRLVYELYDLTEEEIRIVEEATKTD